MVGAKSIEPRPPRAVFLDRDGILVVPIFRDGRSFAPKSIEEFSIYPDAIRSVERLRAAGFKIIVVSNQPDVGAGIISADLVEHMNARLSDVMSFDAIKICYHTKEEHCLCRKPLPGMLLEAAREVGVDLSTSVMVGDRASDVEAGAAAGCRTVFVDLGYTTEVQPVHPSAVVRSLAEATNWILSSESGVN